LVPNAMRPRMADAELRKMDQCTGYFAEKDTRLTRTVSSPLFLTTV
jgi:hypothetical protein